MIDPGKYRHWKGGLYRVLFVAPYGLTTLPRPEQKIFVETFRNGLRVMDRKPLLDAHEVFVLEALWVGEKQPTLTDPELVVYCDINGVYARTVLEFKEDVVDGRYVREVPRFAKVTEP